LPVILNIETATALCSVSLSDDGRLLSVKETLEERAHARLLTVFITEMLREQGLKIADIDAVAIGKGPGSYTGLRIGVSTAKGIIFGVHKPMLAIGTLNILARQVMLKADLTVSNLFKNPETRICPMIDARRMEVYYSLFNGHGDQVEKVAAKVIDSSSFRFLLENHPVIFTGSGMNKCKTLLDHPNAVFLDHIHPSAEALAHLSSQAYRNHEFVDPAYFEPFYLKDFITTVPKKHLLH
jgi:tRNA threonylcarbamoyladenosine biosynthesis protein TsaB